MITNKGEILANMLKKYKNCYFFLHNTKDINVVQTIMDDGFVFENQFSHSTDRVNPQESVEINYFLFHRKEYGSYTIIIAIPKNIFEIYSAFSRKNDVAIEEIITIKDPYYGDNDEFVFTLSPKHILGFYNNLNSEFTQNKNWDPLFNNCQARSLNNKPNKQVKGER